MESSSILIYFLQKTKIHSDILTFTFAVLGILGAVLLFSNPILAVGIFFFKPILDWSDGHLARIKKQTSEIGKHLDYYSGTLGTVAFYTGVTLAYPIFIPFLIVIFLLGKLDGRARTIDFVCLLILLKEIL